MEQTQTIAERKIKNAVIAKELSRDILHQKFIEAALNLDVSIVEPFIPEEMMLQDLSKYNFLSVLKEHFESIERQHPEDWRIELSNFTCGHCNPGKPLAGFEAYAGNALLPYARFGYFVESSIQGETKDIYICRGIIKNA